jgi:hypothetical protein
MLMTKLVSYLKHIRKNRKNTLHFIIGAIIFILVYHFAGYIISFYSVDQLLLKEVLTIIAYASLAIIVLHPVILFQLLSYYHQVNMACPHLASKTISTFKLIIIANIFIFIHTLITISAINLLNHKQLFQHTAIIFIILIYFLFVSMVSVLGLFEK